MSKIIIALALLVAVSASFLPREDENMFKFMKFLSQNNREYSTVEEFQTRFAIFSANLNKVANHEVFSPFMDVSSQEFNDRLTLNARAIPASRAKTESYRLKNFAGEAPASFDWRSKNAVNGVKDQGQCGSCWAFSAIGNIEGQFAIKKGKLERFSEQQLVDCDTEEDQGCNGGLMDNAFKYLESQGVELEADYKYTGRDGKCKYNKSKEVIKVKSFQDIEQNEDTIKAALFEHGPLSVAVDASAFQFYSGGILSAADCDFQQLNHGVTLIGYGVEDGQDFWLVKNSWGTGWGEEGFIRIERGAGACGINTAVSTAILA